MIHALINRFGTRTVLHDRYFVEGYDGLSQPSSTAQIRRKAGGDGQQRGVAYSSDRSIQVTLSTNTTSTDQIELERQYLNHNYNRYTEPFTYEVTMANGAVYVLRDVHLDSDGLQLPMDFSKLKSGYLVFDLDLIADDPYWHSPQEKSVSFAVTSGGSQGVTFPLAFPMTIGSADLSGTAVVSNSGTVRTWPRVVITGPGIDPYVRNVTTNKTLKISRTIGSSEQVIIRMAPGRQRGVVLVSGGTEINLIGRRTHDSVFWDLPPGTSQVEVGMDASLSGTSGSMEMTWHNMYEGI